MRHNYLILREQQNLSELWQENRSRKTARLLKITRIYAIMSLTAIIMQGDENIDESGTNYSGKEIR